MASKRLLIVFSLLMAHACAGISLKDLTGQNFTNQTSSTAVERTTEPSRSQPIKTAVLDRVGNGINKSCGQHNECVPRHVCVNGAISRTGAKLFNIRHNSNGCNYNKLCCGTRSKRDVAAEVFAAVPKMQHKGCGWRNMDGVGFRISGDDDNQAQFGEFPWTVAILRHENNGDELLLLYVCGGSLIAPNVVLTAAHCVNNSESHQLTVRAGEWDTESTNEILSHEDKPVKEIISHEKYHKTALYNDVALLVINGSFNWQEHIRPICLPPPNTNFDHSRCYAAGWGKDKFGREGKYQVILKKIDLPVVPSATCQNQLRQTRLGLYYNLHESFLCAGGEKDKDTCQGDGGSPLICPIPGVSGRYYQAGIVAWGVGCAEENVPGVYANVAHLRPWISEKLSSKGIEFSHFTP